MYNWVAIPERRNLMGDLLNGHWCHSFALLEACSEENMSPNHCPLVTWASANEKLDLLKVYVDF